MIQQKKIDSFLFTPIPHFLEKKSINLFKAEKSSFQDNAYLCGIKLYYHG